MKLVKADELFQLDIQNTPIGFSSVEDTILFSNIYISPHNNFIKFITEP